MIRDRAGLVLNVRKRGTTALMLPGGKPEHGETAAQTAVREFAEELGVDLDINALTELGEFRSAAANEADHVVVATVFEHPYVANVTVSAEIEELQWIDPTRPPHNIAPLNTEHVFPALRQS